MKVYILVDAEGITGVVNHEMQAKPGSVNYEEMRTLYTSDLNAAVEGAVESGAEDIIVYDMHYYGHNVILKDLNPVAKLIMGKPPKITAPAGIDDSIDALVMIGYHAMAQTENALLSHTYTLDMKALHLNGILMGEIGLEAAIAGSRNVPLALVSGDDAAIDEANALLGTIEGACVKYGTGDHSALCLPPLKTAPLIKEKVKSALNRLEDFKPFVVNSPYTIEIEYYEKSSADKAQGISGVSRKDTKTIEMTGEDLPSLWENFLHRYSA